jgi:hypothetical protein
MPLEPVTEYDQARYPTLEEMAHRRREFLSRVGLAAIAAAFGPHVIGCSVGGRTQEGERRGDAGRPGTQPTPPTPAPAQPTPPPVPLAGVPAPANWPGPRGAIVGGGPVEIAYADGVTGWVVVAAVFDAANDRLESALVAAEAWIAEAIRKRLGRERSGFLRDPKRSRAAQAAVLDAIRAIVGVTGLQSVSLAEVDAEAARAARPEAPVPPPTMESVPRIAPPATAAPPAASAGGVPHLAAPAAPRLEAMEVGGPPIRRLPRAGARCPIHPNGCRRSDGG